MLILAFWSRYRRMCNGNAIQVFCKIKIDVYGNSSSKREIVLRGKLEKSEPSTECPAQQTKILSTCG